MSEEPVVRVYDLSAFLHFQADTDAAKTRPAHRTEIRLAAHATHISACWHYISHCLPGIHDFASDEEAKAGTNRGLKPLLDRLGIVDLLETRLAAFDMKTVLPPGMRAAAPIIDEMMGPQKLYELNVKPLLENPNDLWGARLYDQASQG
jgi:hypothetical protein